MCKTPNMPAPVAPTQYAAMRAPNREAVSGAGDRMSDSIRAGQSTVLTSPFGVMNNAPTGGKTLLGA